MGYSWIIKGDYKKSIKVINNESSIIKMYGITFVVMKINRNIEKYSKSKLKEYAYNILNKEKLLNSTAAGVIFSKIIDEKNIVIYPVVYVSKIKTLFYETACGSGTTALAIYESMKRNSNVDINVLQPSGEIINVKTMASNNKINDVIISGKVGGGKNE